MNYKQIIARRIANEKRWLRLNADIPTTSGIYVLTRKDDKDIKYAYIGQSNNLLRRLGEHLSGYQHIDLSLRKHGLWADNNIFGWDITELIETDNLNEMEQAKIKEYNGKGYWLLNATTGSQGEGKQAVNPKPRKGYAEGKKLGYEKARADVRNYFEKYLTCSTKTTKVIDLKKLQEFTEWLKGEES